MRDGFTSLTTLAPDEVAGNVLLAQSAQQLQLQAIGEWGISVTPLELARAYRNIALLRTNHDANLTPLFQGLQQSVSYGMGHAAQPASAMKVAGKTGTAPADEGPWTHAWFAGYAPAENPEIVLVVFLEKGHGGADAAGVAREIFAAFADAQNSRVARQSCGSASVRRLVRGNRSAAGAVDCGGRLTAATTPPPQSQPRQAAFPRRLSESDYGICIRRMTCGSARMRARRVAKMCDLQSRGHQFARCSGCRFVGPD